jgi:hypothetical protein
VKHFKWFVIIGLAIAVNACNGGSDQPVSDSSISQEKNYTEKAKEIGEATVEKSKEIYDKTAETAKEIGAATIEKSKELYDATSEKTKEVGAEGE